MADILPHQCLPYEYKFLPTITNCRKAPSEPSSSNNILSRRDNCDFLTSEEEEADASMAGVWRAFSRTKTTTTRDLKETELSRCLGVFDLTALGSAAPSGRDLRAGRTGGQTPGGSRRRAIIPHRGPGVTPVRPHRQTVSRAYTGQFLGSIEGQHASRKLYHSPPQLDPG
ncbi:hypothetical protein Bbelb_218090 [Branchiostoma belcheri]|nr:hypothetical protein Bbelb_218090 [Branchiostoma belcheri]